MRWNNISEKKIFTSIVNELHTWNVDIGMEQFFLEIIPTGTLIANQTAVKRGKYN